MVALIELEAGAAKLVLAPELGGAIARLDIADRPLLRPWQGDEANPFSLASNILVPFSNRISGGGFTWNDIAYAIEPNLAGEPFPIHGDGFQRYWQSDRTADGAKLVLPDGAIGPWRYRAEQRFVLGETSLEISLSITNSGAVPLPFGCGFHPWFPRHAATRLSFAAETVWMEDERYLPTEKLSLATAPTWDFAKPRALPESWINNGYGGWRGTAWIEQGDEAVSCVVEASNSLGTALVFSPDQNADFFCFEPVSHPVDAFNLPGRPALHELAHGEQMLATMRYVWRQAQTIA